MYVRKDQTIYLVGGITDMRKQINGLSAIAQERQSEALFSGAYFVFLGKTRKVMKILYWDRTGFCLWNKRLEEETFPWTRKQKGLIEIERSRFRLLVKGIDIFREHRKLEYVSVS
jgi:transposase